MRENPNNIKGVTAIGKPFAFTNEDLAVMKQNTRLFDQSLQKELIRREVEVLKAKTDDENLLGTGALSDEFAGLALGSFDHQV